MKASQENCSDSNQSKFLLALHSSSDTLGVAITDLKNIKKTIKISTFPLGRKLSNKIITCIRELLPANNWQNIERISVATGPGGFTGTRLTILMARILAQQINCDLDGISSFELMAPRLMEKLTTDQRNQPFWIIKDLGRRGTVAGRYCLESKLDENCKTVHELESPHLLKKNRRVYPAINAEDDVIKDVSYLLEKCLFLYKQKKQSLWNNVLPIYPTSPVSNNQ